jgi:sarcosine oxidase subunit gamma
MADTLERRSPLQGFVSRFAQTPGAARVTEEPFVAMVDVWVAPVGRAAVVAAAGADASVIWLGPEELLVTSASRDGEELEAALREAVAEPGGAAGDVSAQRTRVRVSGVRARDVLAKSCSLDLHPAVFSPGATAQTVLAQTAVVLIPLADLGTDYRILVRSSFARHLAEWLLDASQEFA